ncbi:hypothetical protein NBRC116588_07770 [Pyruvatibacter sp. HU-CL02332]
MHEVDGGAEYTRIARQELNRGQIGIAGGRDGQRVALVKRACDSNSIGPTGDDVLVEGSAIGGCTAGRNSERWRY